MLCAQVHHPPPPPRPPICSGDGDRRSASARIGADRPSRTVDRLRQSALGRTHTKHGPELHGMIKPVIPPVIAPILLRHNSVGNVGERSVGVLSGPPCDLPRSAKADRFRTRNSHPAPLCTAYPGSRPSSPAPSGPPLLGCCCSKNKSRFPARGRRGARPGRSTWSPSVRAGNLPIGASPVKAEAEARSPRRTQVRILLVTDPRADFYIL